MDRIDRLRDAVEAFNLKVDSIHGDSAGYQPVKLNLNDLAAKFQNLTYSEFSREINRINRYLLEGAENIVTTAQGKKTTVYELKEINNIINSINRKNENISKQYKPSTQTGTMGTLQSANLMKRTNRAQTIEPSKFDKYLSNIKEQLLNLSDKNRQEKFKNNYLKAIANNLVADPENPEKLPLYNRVKAIPADQIERMYFQNPFLGFDYVYGPEDAQYIIERINEELDEFI